MKIQYLGDWRDAFKWDLLHWLCMESVPSFERLVFVPLLTPDDSNPVDGRISPSRFLARPQIRAFVEELGRLPRDLRRVSELSAVVPTARLEVIVHGHDRYVPAWQSRHTYWEGFDWGHANTLVFLDPDNGFETKNNRGGKWVLHAEVRRLVDNLPSSSAVAVYQHRPRQTWTTVFANLASQLTYAPFAGAAYDPGLAFVLATRSSATYERIASAAIKYADGHDRVRWTEIRRSNE